MWSISSNLLQDDTHKKGAEFSEYFDFTYLEELNFVSNPHLRQTIQNILKKGIAISKQTSVNRIESEAETSDNFFVYRSYIFDLDDIKYKIEAHLDLSYDENTKSVIEEEKCQLRDFDPNKNFTAFDNRHESNFDKNTFEGAKNVEIKSNSATAQDEKEETRYIKPSVFFVYVHHPFFHQIWLNGASDMMLFYFSDSSICRCSEIFDDYENFQLEIQVFAPTDSRICDELAIQISKIRERLQCGPFQRFFRLVASHIFASKFLKNHKNKKIRDQQVQIRKNEVVWLFLEQQLMNIVFLITYPSSFDACLAKIWMMELEAHIKQCSNLSPFLKISFYMEAPSSVLQYLKKKKLPTPIANVGYLSINLDTRILKYDDNRLRSYSSTRLGNLIGSLRSFLDIKICDVRKSLRVSYHNFTKDVSQLCENLLL